METKKQDEQKKYYLMFEMSNCIYYSSYSFDSLEEAKRMLKFMCMRSDPLLVRAAVGFWEFVKCEDGCLRTFKMCAEFHRIDK